MRDGSFKSPVCFLHSDISGIVMHLSTVAYDMTEFLKGLKKFVCVFILNFLCDFQFFHNNHNNKLPG